MEKICGLVWETERPSCEVVRRSPKFWLLGYEWNFSLTLFYSRPTYSYKITLRKLSNIMWLDPFFTVTVYVRSSRTSTCLCSTTSDKGADRCVWSSPTESADKALDSDMHFGKWTVTFIFHSDQPLRLHLSKKKTELASSKAVSEPQLISAPDSRNLSKTVLSEEKCVQASIDVPPDLENLSGDLHQLLEREIFSDVTVRCGDRSISAHRSILAARSEVFRNKMAESGTGTLDVMDVDSEVIDLLLQYVYSGKTPCLSDDTARSLYAASKNYSILALKTLCSDWLVKNLTAENCLGFLLLAEAHSGEDFRDSVVDFAAENLESIKKEAWSQFSRDHGGLAFNVCKRRLASVLAKQA